MIKHITWDKMKENLLTIFTPTYNRKHLLPRLYESLKRQSLKNFIWLVIDDGSSDGTEELIKQYIEENSIQIEYHWKINGGVHTASNEVCKYLKTELVVFAPSDCVLMENMVSCIDENWSIYRLKGYAGMFFHYAYLGSQKLLGEPFPNNVEGATFIEFVERYNISADKILVLNACEYLRKKYPEYETEKLFPDSWKFFQISGQIAFVDEILLLVEYTDDGYTKNLLRVMANCPNGYFQFNEMKLSVYTTLKRLIPSMVHYIGFGKLSKEKKLYNRVSQKALYVCCYPIGLVWYFRLSSIQRRSSTNRIERKLLEHYRKNM